MAAKKTAQINLGETERARRFREEREKLNQIVMSYGDLTIKRFFSLDNQAYRANALPAKIKELLGFVSSLVLRCDDCILYHLIRCEEEGVTDDELVEAAGVGLIVGGSITIPHLRRALQAWDEMKGAAKAALSSRQIPFKSLIAAVLDIVATGEDRDVKLKRISTLLVDTVPYYNWAGFYFVDPEKPDELVLGPYAGEPTEHTRIPFGKGICGQAAARKETVVVQDVSRETNYLACGLQVKAEIVVPMFKEGKLIGELDIDSHELAPFTDADRQGLNTICQIAASLF